MKHLDKVPILIIIVGVIAIIFFFSSNNKLTEEISVAEAIKKVSDKQLEIYSDIDNHYGRASNEFYSNKPVVVLRGSGATEVIRIYIEKNGEDEITAFRNSSALETDWGADDGKWTPYTITSKISKGYEIIRFENKTSTETFKVLVVVK